MDQIQYDKIKAKLAKIKELAERGVGGEKETAMRMYEELSVAAIAQRLKQQKSHCISVSTKRN